MELTWIAVDWGMSNLRVWAMRGGEVLAKASSDQGMGQPAGPEGDEQALMALIAPWLARAAGPVPVFACGMIGARQGWLEVPYIAAPCAPPAAPQAGRASLCDSRLDLSILPGVSQSDPADVMCGEETRIAGVLTQSPEFDGVICLPGRHSKWVHISAGEIVSFRSFLTGELFALLSERSVLRHSMADDGWDRAAFDAALSDTMSAPHRFSARLFSLRAAGLLQGVAPGVARARLSGMLLGLELAGAREYWLGQSVALIGAPALTGLYHAALQNQGVTAQQLDEEESVLAGLRAAYDSAQERPRDA